MNKWGKSKKAKFDKLKEETEQRKEALGAQAAAYTYQIQPGGIYTYSNSLASGGVLTAWTHTPTLHPASLSSLIPQLDPAESGIFSNNNYVYRKYCAGTDPIIKILQEWM